jgi:hypothetical protein
LIGDWADLQSILSWIANISEESDWDDDGSEVYNLRAEVRIGCYEAAYNVCLAFENVEKQYRSEWGLNKAKKDSKVRRFGCLSPYIL